MSRNAMLLAAGVLLAAAFLVGFIPEHLKSSALAQQAQAARQQSQWQELTLSIGRVFVQTDLKNYGLAGQAASGFFDRARTLLGQPDENPDRRKFLQSALSQRDAITAGLAKGDAAVRGSIEALFQSALQLAGAQ